MKRQYIEAAVRAEIRRAKRDGRDPNRIQLRRETGLTIAQLEFLISETTRDLASAPTVASGAGQGPVRPGEVNPTNKPTRNRTGPR